MGYCTGNKDDTTEINFGNGHTAEDMIHRAWEVCMAGAYVCYYYSYTAWDVIDPSWVPRGYGYFRVLYRFFTGLAWWTLAPAHQRCIWHGRCLENEESIIFYFAAGKARALIRCAPDSVKAFECMDAYSGERVEIAYTLHTQGGQSLLLLDNPFPGRPWVVKALK